MRHFWFALVLAAAIALALPLATNAIGLDVEAKVAGGVALGSTNNPDESGSPRAGFLGGVGVDVYLFTVGPVNLGVSVGAEYASLNFHGVLTNYLSLATGYPGITQTSDSTYNYLQIPISLVGKIPFTQSIGLTVRAGAFIGHFLGGTSSLSYNSNPYAGTPYEPTSQTLDSTTTLVPEYGLHFTGDVDIALSKGLAVSPGVQFDVGLSNTSATDPKTGVGPYPFSDTFWSVTATVAIKYTVF